MSLQSHSSPPSQVQSCVIVIVVVIKVFPGQGVGHLQDDCIGHARARKIATFSFLLLICLRSFCDNVDNDDSKEYDMITKAFVKNSQNLSLIAPKKLIPKKIPG